MMIYKPTFSFALGPVNNQLCWWYELQTDLFTCLCTRDKQQIMMMAYGFFFRRGGWRLCQPEPQKLRWFAVHYFDNVFIDDLFCNHHYKDFVFFVIFSWLFRSRGTHALLERKGRRPVWLRSRQDLTWLICKTFQSKIDFVDLANIWKKTFQADIIMGIHLRKRLFFYQSKPNVFRYQARTDYSLWNKSRGTLNGIAGVNNDADIKGELPWIFCPRQFHLSSMGRHPTEVNCCHCNKMLSKCGKFVYFLSQAGR